MLWECQKCCLQKNSNNLFIGLENNDTFEKIERKKEKKKKTKKEFFFILFLLSSFFFIFKKNKKQKYSPIHAMPLQGLYANLTQASPHNVIYVILLME